MRKKVLSKKQKIEKMKFLAVVSFFLLCGVIYSHSFYRGSLDMGTPIRAEEIAKPKKELPAEDIRKIDLNTAGVEELILLSEIGEKRASEIIRYREENGDFSQVEDIMEVSGIGEKIFEEIKEQITVGE